MLFPLKYTHTAPILYQSGGGDVLITLSSSLGGNTGHSALSHSAFPTAADAILVGFHCFPIRFRHPYVSLCVRYSIHPHMMLCGVVLVLCMLPSITFMPASMMS